MQEINLSQEKKNRSNSMKVNLQVFLFEEDNIYFAYMPSFDLTGYGETAEEAKESLTIILDEFLRYTSDKKTLLIEMQRLGWDIKDKKKSMRAPQISDMINSNEQLKEIINSKQYTASNYQTNIPALNA